MSDLRDEPTLTRLSSGYTHAHWTPEYWAQWPEGVRPGREHVFNPEWNWERFSRWVEERYDRPAR
jgi:hypothetical protein